MTDTAPRIYVACLASYNNGVLHGRWIDASADVADMWPEINAILRESKFPNVTVPDYEAAAKAVGWHWDEGGPHFYRNAPGASALAPYEYAHLSHEDWRDLCEMVDIDVSGHMVPSAEEWAIHDYEGLGPGLGEYAGLAEVARRVAIVELAEERDIPAAILIQYASEYMSGDWDVDALESELDDHYDGSAESWEAFTEEQFTETGGLEGVPESVQNYIDFERMARDWELGGDWSAYRDSEGGNLHFFRTH